MSLLLLEQVVDAGLGRGRAWGAREERGDQKPEGHRTQKLARERPQQRPETWGSEAAHFQTHLGPEDVSQETHVQGPKNVGCTGRGREGQGQTWGIVLEKRDLTSGV